MNKLAKWAFSVTLLVAANLGFASDENTRMLEVHTRECIDFLQAFATEDFNPQKALRTTFENGVLVIRYDDEVIKQSDDLAQKWMNDCGDLFDVDKYGPKLFRNSPLRKVLEEMIRDQNFARRNPIKLWRNKLPKKRNPSAGGPCSIMVLLKNWNF